MNWQSWLLQSMLALMQKLKPMMRLQVTWHFLVLGLYPLLCWNRCFS